MMKLRPNRWQDWFLFKPAACIWRWIRTGDNRLLVAGLILVLHSQYFHGWYWSILTYTAPLQQVPDFPGRAEMLLVDSSALLSAVLVGIAGLSAFVFTVVSQQRDMAWRFSDTRIALVLHLLLLGTAMISVIGLVLLDPLACEVGFPKMVKLFALAIVAMGAQIWISTTRSHPVLKRIAAWLPLAHMLLVIRMLPVIFEMSSFNRVGCIP